MTCSHGMPSPASCIDCMDDDGLGVAPVQPIEIAYTFTASRTAGRCPVCDHKFHRGEALARTTDDTYLHERCIP